MLRITKDDYDKKLYEYGNQQMELESQHRQHIQADHQYHIHVSTVFSLASEMKELFNSSETVEKRAILSFLLQNPVLNNKKLEFSIASPFNLLLEIEHHPTLLPG